MPARKTTESFIQDAISVHGDKYDYSKATNANTPVTVICPIHGEFTQRPNLHTSHKQGCPSCGNIQRSKSNRLPTDEFIKRLNLSTEIMYKYNHVNYINNKTPIQIECMRHGVFKQSPSDHLKSSGCRICGYESHHTVGGYSEALFESNPELKAADGYLYVCEMVDSTDGKFIKVGINKRDPIKRIKDFRTIYNKPMVISHNTTL